MSQEPHYIVVGAGAAGGVMAARLSEDREKRVLLLETGVDYERDGSNEGLPDAILYGYGNPGNPGPAEVRGHHWYPEPAAETAALANDILLYPGPLQSRAGSAPTSAGDRTFMIQATLMLGLSAGTVTLAPPKPDGTPDVEAMPVIEMGWLTHEADRIRLRDAMRLSLQLAESAEMSTVIERPIAPADDEVNSESADSVFDSWIASNVVSSQHQTSTCRMGGPHDPEAVCDEEGRVFGTEGLRVVDASLMPDCPRANTQATTYMIGERIARIINAGSLETAIRAVSQSTS